MIADKITDIISCASNWMMGGKALSRNAKWTVTSINFTTDVWLAAQRLKRYPHLLRPIAQYLIPEMARVRNHGAVARRVIVPIIEKRLRAKEMGNWIFSECCGTGPKAETERQSSWHTRLLLSASPPSVPARPSPHICSTISALDPSTLSL